MNNRIVKLVSGFIAGLGLAAVSPANAIVIGGETIATVNSGVILDGTESSSARYFAKEFSISKSENRVEYAGIDGSPVYTNNPDRDGVVRLSDLPVDDASSPAYFRIAFNSNEPGGRSEKSINIDDLVIAVAGTVIFDYDQATFGKITLDGTTASPTSNATADLAVLLPIRLVSGLGFNGASALTIYWSLSDNGRGRNLEQWAIVGVGHFADSHSFDSIAPIAPTVASGPAPTAAPSPAVLALLASGSLGLAGLRLRRRG